MELELQRMKAELVGGSSQQAIEGGPQDAAQQQSSQSPHRFDKS